LIFEDLHWVDPASRSFLEYLIQTTNDTPLLLILISRDAERETAIRPLIAAAEQDPAHLVDLQLQALSEPAGELLVEQLIPQSTAEARLLKKRIAGRAEGNPFYAEEIIRMLVDQGGLIGETGAWLVTPKAIELLGEVPDTVKGLVLARFDRLPEALRQTLQKAAVLGMSFPVSLLQLLNGVDSHTLTVQLGELVARQFLVNISLGSGQGYTFRHALIQEAIYGTLLKRDQQIIHMRVAQAVEQGTFLPPEEKVQMLAYHYAESTCPSQALPYLIAAADNAARRCAYETAVDHYRRAMALLPDMPDEDGQEFFQVRIGLGRALKFLGEFTTASQILVDTLYWLWGWSLQVAPAAWSILVDNLRELADVWQREGAYNEALVYLEAGLHILDRNNAAEVSHLRCSLLDRMAWIRFRQGQLEEAFALASKATEDLRAENDHNPILLASLYNTLGGICWQQARLAEAITYVERSLAIYKNLGYLWGTGIAYGNLGVLWDDQGNWPKATSYYRQAYTFNQMMGELQNQAGNLDNLGTLYRAMGRHDAARRELETALRIRQQLGDNWGMAQSQVNLAHLALVQANFDETATFATAALNLAETIGSSDIQVHARWILALVRAEKESPQAGLAYAEETLQIAQATGPLDEEANCYRVLGVLHARAGRYDTAETLLVQSIDLSIQLNNPYLQALALLELGRVYQALAEFADPSDSQWPARATDSLTQAVELFESLGAMHDLKLARTAAHHLPH
jgi:tetratricopeptide (TPR) repeat protein